MTTNKSERIAAIRNTMSNTDDRQVLMEVEQILRRLESSGGEFEVTNIVSHRTGKGMLDVAWMGQLAQMTPEKARETAWILLEAAAVAEAEAMLMRFLRERVGLSPEKAAGMLSDFRRYRQQEPGSLVGSETH
jgi:hypothetical protein